MRSCTSARPLHELDEPVGVENVATWPWTAASSSAFASAASSSCVEAGVGRGAGRSGSRSQTMSAAVRSVAVMTGKLFDLLSGPNLMHHQEARGEAGPLEEVLRLAVTGKRRRRRRPTHPASDAERDEPLHEQLPHPDRPGLGLHVDLARSRRAASRREAPRRARCRSRRRARRACRRSRSRRRGRRARRSAGRAARAGPPASPRARRPCSPSSRRGNRARELGNAREVVAGRDPRVFHGEPTRRSDRSCRESCAGCGARPRRCAPLELVRREPGEALDHLRRRQRVVARDRQRVARPGPRRW